MRLRIPLAVAVLAGLTCVTSFASPINGTFNIGGTITVTPTTITWSLGSSPFTPMEATMNAGGTGDFAALDGSSVTIQNLDNTTEPVGSVFPEQPFIAFLAAPSFPTLNINFIFPGIYSSASCGAPPAVGQNCTLPGSPFNFVNNPPGPPNGPQATATFVFTGVTSDGLENWQGNFTSQFTVPYQTVLSRLQTQGFVSNTFSATFVVTPQVPEAGTAWLLGLGLSLVAISFKLRHRRA